MRCVRSCFPARRFRYGSSRKDARPVRESGSSTTGRWSSSMVVARWSANRPRSRSRACSKPVPAAWYLRRPNMPAAPDLPLAAAIIVAAGRGTRLGAADKVLLPLAGRPLLSYCVDAAEAALSITEIVIVAGLHTKHAVEDLVRQSGW